MKRPPVTVKELMTPDPVAVGADASVEHAERLMRKHEIRHLPVVKGGRLVGIVSTKDLEHGGKSVADVMSHTVLTLAPGDPIEKAAATMALRRISSLLVVEDHNLVGIVTTYDLLDALAWRLRDMSGDTRP